VGKDFLEGIKALMEFGLTYDILIFPKQLPAALGLAMRHPDQPFVLDHLAKPLIKTGKMSPWKGGIRELAKNRNVMCKLSGLVTEADWKAWTPERMKPYLDVVFEAFGPERLMFGSDWPVCLLAGDYAPVLGIIEAYIARMPRADQDAVLGGNAARFYRL
jgi:L-fuconolactonase